jgi:hypothetical protein
MWRQNITGAFACINAQVLARDLNPPVKKTQLRQPGWKHSD